MNRWRTAASTTCSVAAVNLFVHVPHAATVEHKYIFSHIFSFSHTHSLISPVHVIKSRHVKQRKRHKIIKIMCLIEQKVSAVISLNSEAFSFYNMSSCLTWRRWWERGPPAQLSWEVIYAHAAELYSSKQWCRERDRNMQRSRERRGQRLAPVCLPAGCLSSSVSERFDQSFTLKKLFVVVRKPGEAGTPRVRCLKGPFTPEAFAAPTVRRVSDAFTQIYSWMDTRQTAGQIT